MRRTLLKALALSLAGAFYAGFVTAGGLCFDIGAHSGNRPAVFQLTENRLGCIGHLARLGPVSLTLSWGESMRRARRRWLTEAEIKALLNQFREETWLFADLYVRSETP